MTYGFLIFLFSVFILALLELKYKYNEKEKQKYKPDIIEQALREAIETRKKM